MSNESTRNVTLSTRNIAPTGTGGSAGGYRLNLKQGIRVP